MELSSLSLRYTPHPGKTAVERDLLMLEQEPWGDYVGVLTKLHFVRYLHGLLYGSDDESEPVDCGWGDRLALTVYAYPLAPGVRYRLASTVGIIEEMRQETVQERQSVSFDLERSASLPRPATRILASEWLAGPYTTGGARVSAPALSVSGREVISPIPLFGSVWLTLELQRGSCMIVIDRDEAEPLLAAGWSEFVVGMPAGGRPVALDLDAPPGAEEMAKLGLACGRGSAGNTVDWPPDQGEPIAQPRDKHVECDYCELQCEGEDNG